jgi:hypothetical protein
MSDVRDKWDIVSKIFEDGDACVSCDFRDSEYYSDWGWTYSCRLLEQPGGQPEFCPDYARVTEDPEEEEDGYGGNAEAFHSSLKILD